MKILLFDIETAPNLAYVWARYEQNVIEMEKSWYILSFSCKWLGESKTHVYGLPDFKEYRRDTTNDYGLVRKLWDFLDEADIVVAHNGDRFDIKKANAKFIEHGLNPPSPYKSVDTLKIARQVFKFDSNKLDDLGDVLKVGRKLRTGGKDLWMDCIRGDMKAWKKMLAYNKQDVLLLERVYLKFRSWSTNHPNVTVFEQTKGCPKCGSWLYVKRGFGIAGDGIKQKYRCNGCEGWFQRTVKKNEFRPQA